MGPWASAVVAVAAAAGVFFVVMGFRGLIEAIEQASGRCAQCGRVSLLPLPLGTRRCLHCHVEAGWVGHVMARRLHGLHR
jgi:hypothetical protein